MLIFKEWVAPNAAQTTIHRLQVLELIPSLPDVVRVTINSYPNEAAERIAWQERYEITRSVLNGEGDPEALVLGALTGAGAPLDGGVLVPTFEADLLIAKAIRRAQVKQRRDAAEWAGCDTPYGRVQTDPTSQLKASGAVQLALIAIANDQPFSVGWTFANNETIPLEASDMIAVGVAIGQHVAACHAHALPIQAAIDAIEPPQTFEDVAAIDIDSGWPMALLP